MAFNFYEIKDPNAAAATISFQRGIEKMAGGYAAQNLLKSNANYRRASGHSTIRNFKWIPATAFERNEKTVDLAKAEKDYIRNGMRAQEKAEYLEKITQIQTQHYRMQMFPKSAIIQSDAVSKTEALLAGNGNYEAGLINILGNGEFAEAALASETNENNTTFLKALRNKTITFKKTRWDGGIADEDNDITVQMPAFTQYTCANAWFDINDFSKMRAQMWNNMTDAPEFRRPLKLLISPNQWQQMIEKNEKLQNSDFMKTSGVLETGQLPVLMGFYLEVHPQVSDNEAFAFVPGLTVGVDDWGTFTDTRTDADIWTLTTARRQYNYDCKVVQPLTMLQISFTGATDNKPVGMPGSETGDEIFDKVRDPNGILG